MNAMPDQPQTALDVLFDGTDIATALQASGACDVVRGRLADFTEATRDQAVHEVERISAGFLNLSLADVIIGALVSYVRLQEAARRTAAAPETEELVELISHEVDLDNRPSIELLVDGTQVATVRMLLSLVITIEALTATVREGRLVTVQIGSCDIDATLCIEGVPVASKQAKLQLPARLALDPGITLAKPEQRQVPSAGQL
jgi:hypothetical protein